ncbi:MAG: sigma-70 family RNA polymerase sigma factor [Candidatus Aminicenantes bacterium]|nr:sigma-70 family RNA polymerase sigma factor [Candidatus Aminicenantes bacterium]
MESTADDVLVERAQAGDVDAFAELAGRLQERIYRTILGMTRSPEDADDLTQDAFMTAFRSLKSFRRNSSFYTWVYRIAVNLTLNHLKKKGREKGRAPFEDGAAVLDKTGYAAGSPEGGSLNRELKGKLEEAIGRLRPVYQAAFNLVVVQGMSHGRAAEVLGCSENTVSWRMHKARKMLRARLQPYLGEAQDAM